ncbi:MAG: hypothetical protein WB791_00595, partial [Waddliaceae bacterium]
KRGYPIGSGVVEGACKNLVKDRMEQCGMRWTIAGAEAVPAMRSIQINGMTGDYWQYHIAQEKQRLYGNFMEKPMDLLTYIQRRIAVSNTYDQEMGSYLAACISEEQDAGVCYGDNEDGGCVKIKLEYIALMLANLGIVTY